MLLDWRAIGAGASGFYMNAALEIWVGVKKVTPEKIRKGKTVIKYVIKCGKRKIKEVSGQLFA